MAAGARRVLVAVLQGARGRGRAGADSRRARSLEAVRGALPRVRRAGGTAQWPLRAVHRLRQVPRRLHVQPLDQQGQGARPAHRRDLQGVRVADGHQDGGVRGVPRLRAVPEVQAHAAGAAGDQVPQVRHRRPGRAAHAQGTQLLWVPAVSGLRLLGVEQAGGRGVPELRVRGAGSEADQGGWGRTQVPQVRTRSPGGGARAHGAGRDLTVTVIGGGLAGSEAAWALARCGIRVTLREMRPVKMTPAHHTDRLAELVCSNSFKSVELTNANGLLNAEMRRLGSIVLAAADAARVPGGAALAVDRVAFAQAVHERVTGHPRITLQRGEVTELESPGVVATGPLTSDALAAAIARRLEAQSLAFFDAIAPIVAADSLDDQRLFRASRYGKGGGDDYWNAPLTEEQYDTFVTALRTGEQYQPHHEFDRTPPPYFEGCLPVEELAARGRDALRFGPMKPVGLVDPRAGARGQPYAVVQLRQEDRA